MTSVLNNWKKLENETGYPYYVGESTGQQQYDHPQFIKIMKSLEEYTSIKYSVYRVAYKIFTLQKQLGVPPLRIASGVFARHQLSLSESSLSLDTAELEAVLADIYFAAKKEGLFSGDVDMTVDLLINLMLNVFDKDRKDPVKVLAAKALLIILSDESVADKWLALANCCADHNGCVSPRRLAALLTHMIALPLYLGDSCDQLQTDIDSCFAKNAGMLGVTARAVAGWGAQHCASTRWLSVVDRITASRNISDACALCANCAQPLIQVLKFKCSRCNNVYLCEKCYLYGNEITSVNGHKKTHVVLEVFNGEVKPSECTSFMKTVKRFFFCTKSKKKKNAKKNSRKVTSVTNKVESGSVRRQKYGKPAIFTSTVGKASGNTASNPTSMLQDIIIQLEAQNQALKELSDQLQKVANGEDDALKSKVDLHFSQISAQINRLKILKENLVQDPIVPPEDTLEKIERPQAFDIFSPILVEDAKPSKRTENLKSQPRVLSLDSGNFSVVSKQVDSQNLMTMSGDALKPVVIHATSDSISTVSMNDISSWYHETESLAPDKRVQQSIDCEQNTDCTSQSISATEQRFAADIRTVETSNDKMKELNADLDTVLDRLQQILTNNFAMDDSCFDNTQLRETANEMEGLLGSLIRGVEQRATLNATRGMV